MSSIESSPVAHPRSRATTPGRASGRRAPMSKSTRQWWLVGHFLGMGVYLAGVLGVLVLMLVGGTPAERAQAHYLAGWLDWVLIIPGTHLVLITGIVLAWRTRYTLRGHWWIVSKLVVNVALIAFGGIVMRQWAHSRELGSYLRTDDAAILTSPEYLGDVVAFRVALVVIAVSLAAIVAISVIKPWGRAGASSRHVVAATLGCLVGVDASFGVASQPEGPTLQVLFAVAGTVVGLAISLLSRPSATGEATAPRRPRTRATADGREAAKPTAEVSDEMGIARTEATVA